jgi:hypothetical protein
MENHLKQKKSADILRGIFFILKQHFAYVIKHLFPF